MASRLLRNLLPGTARTGHANQHDWLTISLEGRGFNVRDYGAVGDGTTDDTVAIQAAITAAQALAPYGGTVYIPDGTFKITDTLDITNHVTIAGPGKISQVTLTEHVFYINACSNVKVRDVTLTHVSPVTKSTFHMFYIKDSSRIIIDSVKVLAAIGAGINAVNVQHAVVKNCDFSGTLSDGIHFEQALEDILITGNSVTVSGDDGISCQGINGDAAVSKNCRVIGNYVYQTLTRGISMLGVENSVVEGNTVESTKSFGIYVYSEDGTWVHRAVKDIMVANNVLRNVGNYSSGTSAAVRVGNANASRGCSGVTLSQNSITTPYDHFFNIGQASINGTQNIIIRGNQGVGPNTSGNAVNAINVKNLIVADNFFNQPNAHGIYVENDCTGAINISGNTIEDGGAGAVANDSGIAARAADVNVYNNIIVDTTSRLTYDVLNSGARVNMWGNVRLPAGLIRWQAYPSSNPALMFAARISTWNRATNGGIPNVGTWAQGDQVYYDAPIAGGFVGAICTASGSPGTWKTFGAISA